jgi:hypothetical protein
MNTSTAILPQHESVGKSYPTDQDKRVEKDRPVDTRVTAFLLRISEDIEAADRGKRLELFRKMIKSHQYYDGNFYGYVDDNCQWVSRSQRDTERWYSDNQYYPYIRTALMELSRRQTQVKVNAVNKSEEMERVAKFAQARIDANRERTFTAHLRQTENTYALLNGVAYRYTFLNRSGREEKVPRIRRGEGGTEEKSICSACSRPVTGDRCDACGSEFITQMQMPTGPEVVVGYDDLIQSENEWISPNPVSVIVSMQASTIAETPYIKWKQFVLRSVLEDKFKKIDLPSTGTISPELRYITNQQLATPASDDDYFDHEGARTAEEKGNELELLELHQHWLDYAVYCNKKFEEPCKLANGKTLPAGQTLGEMYPNGLYFATVGDVVVDMWSENKIEKWTASPYSLRAGSMYGHGTAVSHQSQETVNDLENLKMANAWSNGVPREFVNPAIITELSVDPTQVTEVNNPDGNPILGFAYAQAPAVALSPEVYALSDTQKGSMQNQIGSMSNAAGGLADAQKWGDTATAISIKRDLAVGRFGPDLELLADNLDKPQAEQFLINEQKYFTPEQWRLFQGDFDDDALKGFLKCNIKRDLIISIVPGSYMPKTEAQETSNLIGFAQIAPVLAQMGSPELMAYAFEKFSIPEHIGGWNSDRAHAQRLTDRFKMLADEFIAQNGDAPDTDLENPMILKAAMLINEYADMPLDVFLDDHMAIQDALKDWRTTDEGRSASNVLVASVAFRMLRHKEAMVKQAQMDTKSAMMAQQPAMEQEQAMMAEQQAVAQEQEAAAQAQAAEQATRQEDMQILQGMAQAEDAEAQRQHEDRQNVRQAAVDVVAAEQKKAAEKKKNAG